MNAPRIETEISPTGRKLLRIRHPNKDMRQLDKAKGEFAYGPRTVDRNDGPFKLKGPHPVPYKKLSQALKIKDELGIPAKPPTTMPVIIGQAFIETCMLLGLDWEQWKTVPPPPEIYNLSPQPGSRQHLDYDSDSEDYEESEQEYTTHRCLGDLWESAQVQCMEFISRHGLIYEDDGTPREPMIGDEVDFLRKSSDDLEELFEEPEEARPDRTIRYGRSAQYFITSTGDLQTIGYETKVDYDPNHREGESRYNPTPMIVEGENWRGSYCIDFHEPETRRWARENPLE